MVLFGPLRPYSVHISFIRFTLVLFCPFVFIQSTLVLFGLFGFIQSYYLQFSLIRSYYVNFGHLVIFGLSRSTSVHFGPYIHTHIHTHIYSHTNKQLYGHFIFNNRRQIIFQKIKRKKKADKILSSAWELLLSLAKLLGIGFYVISPQ